MHPEFESSPLLRFLVGFGLLGMKCCFGGSCTSKFFLTLLCLFHPQSRVPRAQKQPSIMI